MSKIWNSKECSSRSTKSATIFLLRKLIQAFLQILDLKMTTFHSLKRLRIDTGLFQTSQFFILRSKYFKIIPKNLLKIFFKRKFLIDWTKDTRTVKILFNSKCLTLRTFSWGKGKTNSNWLSQFLKTKIIKRNLSKLLTVCVKKQFRHNCLRI